MASKYIDYYAAVKLGNPMIPHKGCQPPTHGWYTYQKITILSIYDMDAIEWMLQL